jgi:hypothetical protein
MHETGTSQQVPQLHDRYMMMMAYQEGTYYIGTQSFSILPPPISVNHYIKVLNQLLKCIICLLLCTEIYLNILNCHKNMQETNCLSFEFDTSIIRV